MDLTETAQIHFTISRLFTDHNDWLIRFVRDIKRLQVIVIII